MFELTTSFDGRPIIFIRYNPDAYKIEGKHKHTPLPKREQLLIKWVEKALKHDQIPPSNLYFPTVLTFYLYYNEYDHTVGEFKELSQTNMANGLIPCHKLSQSSSESNSDPDISTKSKSVVSTKSKTLTSIPTTPKMEDKNVKSKSVVSTKSKTTTKSTTKIEEDKTQPIMKMTGKQIYDRLRTYKQFEKMTDHYIKKQLAQLLEISPSDVTVQDARNHLNDLMQINQK